MTSFRGPEMKTEASAMAAAPADEPDSMPEYPSSPSTCCFCIPASAPARRPRRPRAVLLGAGGIGRPPRGDGGDGGVWSRGLRALKKLREWSEIAAGPRWKTFIRRFNRKAHRQGRFNYDPLDYALNFDEGQGEDADEEGGEGGGGGFRNFSARYAALPGGAKSAPAPARAVDLGRVAEVPVFA
ncbi:uncharacterized protein LOC104418462 [Eucalyptus grandis]|uniref:uncharacterized protein LOC104418462 n=1 Tax=Eucalyptus grandis TaxID=71139 RepID=UPI00192ECFE5|nr:uncharacterized protein LOC104418462 [Eucalyptus grandis]